METQKVPTQDIIRSPHTYDKATNQYLPKEGLLSTKYPKWKFHPDYVHEKAANLHYSATQCAILVHNREEEENLGDEWKDSPAEFGITTAPNEQQVQERRLADSKKQSSWKTAIGAPEKEITKLHVEYLSLHGQNAESVADVYTFLSRLTSAQSDSFMRDAEKWIAKKKAKAAAKES